MKGRGDMDTLLKFATDERIARIALTTITEPGDSTTGQVLRSLDAVNTLTVLFNDEDDDGAVPGLGHVEAQLWQKRLLPRIEPRLSRDAIDRAEQGKFITLILSDEEFPGLLKDLGDRAPLICGSRAQNHCCRLR